MDKDDSNNTHDLSKTLTHIFTLATVLAVGTILLYFFTFGNNLSDIHSRWGEFGDFLGGTLNPLFGFFGLFALLLTISLQSKELKLSRKELKNSVDALDAQNRTLVIQNFENSFFQMLKLHNDIVNEFDLQHTNNPSGRDCFPIFLEKLHRLRSHFSKSIDDPEELLNIAYCRFYEQHQVDLAHYFRYLYNIFKFIDSSQIENKKFYSNLVRAQLSNHELALLFYNCISIHGKEKFHPYLIQYSVLKHLPTTLLFSPDDKNFYHDSAYK